MGPGSILVADDDAAIRTVLNQALSRAGYEVRSTGNAATLWRWVSQGDGDVVITDVIMPDENAFDLLPRIRKGGLRVSPQTVRPEGAHWHRGPGPVRAQGAPAPPRKAATVRFDPARRSLSRHA